MGEKRNGWVRLPERIDVAEWKRVWRNLDRNGAGLDEFFRPAGVRARVTNDGGVIFKTERFDFLQAEPLVNAAGEFRGDAAARVRDSAFNVDLTAPARRERRSVDLLGRHQQTQLILLAGGDPLEVLEPVIARGEAHAHVLGMDVLGWRRLAFWHFVERFLAGERYEPGFFERTMNNPSELLTGQAAWLVVPPIAAMAQPPVMTFLTGENVSVVLTVRQGYGFIRPPYLPPYPVPLLPNPVGDASVRMDRPEVLRDLSHADRLLTDMVAAGNRTLEHFTNPAVWRDAEGALSINERNITLGSVRFGLEAVNNVAADYGSPAALWEAFRALTTLHGIWQGTRNGRNGIQPAWLFDPRLIRLLALPRIPNDTHRQWCSTVVGTFEAGLADHLGALEGERRDEPWKAAQAVASIRNSVHGIGGDRQDRRVDRFELIREMESRGSGVSLVKDLAGIWWCAALADPQTLLTPGSVQPEELLDEAQNR